MKLVLSQNHSNYSLIIKAKHNADQLKMLQIFNLFLEKMGNIKDQKHEGMAAVVAYLMFASYCLTLIALIVIMTL
ncbi:MAG: hypothetical protein AAFY76_15190 [Cyanobacteria bacterium J06649_11]